MICDWLHPIRPYVYVQIPRGVPLQEASLKAFEFRVDLIWSENGRPEELALRRLGGGQGEVYGAVATDAPSRIAISKTQP